MTNQYKITKLRHELKRKMEYLKTVKNMKNLIKKDSQLKIIEKEIKQRCMEIIKIRKELENLSK